MINYIALDANNLSLMSFRDEGEASIKFLDSRLCGTDSEVV